MSEKEKQRAGGIKGLTWLYSFLRIFTDVKPGEALTVLLLTVNSFLVLAAYYLIKPLREALILSEKGAEFKSYLSAATVVLLIFVVRVFARAASRFPRHKLIGWVTLFFISNLFIFYAFCLLGVGLGTLGVIFFVWVGIFNVMIVAQFWAFANDIYSPEEGKRLFVFVAFGTNFGAFWGSKIAGWLIEPIGLYQLMLVGAGTLGVCILLTLVVHRREMKRLERQREVLAEPLKKGGGFQVLFQKKYLITIAFFVLLLNFINTNGEYILGKVVTETAAEAVAMGTSGGLDQSEIIGKFYADFFSGVNLLAWFIQLLLVSRIFKWAGVRGALFFLPVIALGGYLFIALGASLVIVRWAKTFENSTDYSLMNTTRHSLFLITTRQEKYKAKAAIDTFFHRGGDVLSAGLVALGSILALNVTEFAQMNVSLILLWIILAFLIKKEHKRLSAKRDSSRLPEF